MPSLHSIRNKQSNIFLIFWGIYEGHWLFYLNKMKTPLLRGFLILLRHTMHLLLIIWNGNRIVGSKIICARGVIQHLQVTKLVTRINIYPKWSNGDIVPLYTYHYLNFQIAIAKNIQHPIHAPKPTIVTFTTSFLSLGPLSPTSAPINPKVKYTEPTAK